jgi:hypothetical protein
MWFHPVSREDSNYPTFKDRLKEGESTLAGKSVARSRSLQGMGFQYDRDLKRIRGVSGELREDSPCLKRSATDRSLRIVIALNVMWPSFAANGCVKGIFRSFYYLVRVIMKRPEE